jgi:hypothetical protein
MSDIDRRRVQHILSVVLGGIEQQVAALLAELQAARKALEENAAKGADG